jgi:Arc/MetJ-type ribon-helix-helix transcriptional regulator
MRGKTINISLPENMEIYVKQQVEQHGYGSVSEFFRELVRNYRLERMTKANREDALTRFRIKREIEKQMPPMWRSRFPK